MLYYIDLFCGAGGVTTILKRAINQFSILLSNTIKYDFQ